MGIGAEEILEQLRELQESMNYWQTCQPFLSEDIPFAALAELIKKVEAIKAQQDAR